MSWMIRRDNVLRLERRPAHRKSSRNHAALRFNRTTDRLHANQVSLRASFPKHGRIFRYQTLLLALAGAHIPASWGPPLLSLKLI